MKIEQRLHDAMHEYADAIEPDSGSWARIAARFDEPLASSPRPSRRPLVLVGVALALVVVVITALVVRDTDGKTRVVTGSRAGSMPSRIFAVDGNGHPAVLDATTGRRLFAYKRTLAEGAQFSVAPNGQDAYVVPGPGHPGCNGSSIVQLQIGSGSGSRVVATEATDPAVSPDGRYLAFVHCVPSEPFPEIEVRDLTTASSFAITGTTAVLSGLSWSSDSRNLAFESDRGVFVVDTATASSLDEARCVCELNDSANWFGYLGSTGEFLGTFTSGSFNRAPDRVVALGPDGREVRTLIPWPEQAPPSSSAAQHLTPRSDQSGSNILMTTYHDLYRWSRGDPESTKLADGVIDAVWIPDATRPESTTSMPDGVLAVHGGQRISLLGSQDGQEHETLTTGNTITGVSASADGKQIVFAHYAGLAACGDPSPSLDQIDPETKALTRVGGPSDLPVVSPDGRWVAYGLWCDGTGPGFSSLPTGGNYRTGALGDSITDADARIESTAMLGFSPDSDHVVYRLMFTGDPAPHYYVGALWPAVPQSEAEVIALPSGPGILAATFLDDDTVALAETAGPETSGAPTEVRSWKVRHGSEEQASPVLFSLAARITSLAADQSGQHLLAVTQDGALYRWSRGDAAPTKLADHVTAAVWYPGS